MHRQSSSAVVTSGLLTDKEDVDHHREQHSGHSTQNASFAAFCLRSTHHLTSPKIMAATAPVNTGLTIHDSTMGTMPL